MFADEDEALQGITSSPRYMIKTLKQMCGSNLTIAGYGEDNETPQPTIFRISVRGTNNRTTLLRSHYGKVF